MTALSTNDDNNQQWHIYFEDNKISYLFLAQNSRLTGAWKRIK